MSLPSTGFFAAGLTALAGGGQGGAGAIAKGQTTSQYSTAATAGDSCTLPTPTSPYGQIYSIKNDGANNMSIYPAAGGQINTLGANAAYTLAPLSGVSFQASSATQWFSISNPVESTVTVPATFVANAAGTQAAATLIPTNQFDTKVTTCAGALDSVALPLNPVLQEVYTVSNRTANVCAIFPGTAANASQINDYGSNSNTCYSPLAGGHTASFMALSNAAGVVTWAQLGNIPPINYAMLAAGALVHQECYDTTISLTSAAADFAITLPAPTQGAKLKFLIVATAGTNQVQITATGALLLGQKVLNATWTNENTARTNVFLGNSTGTIASTVGDRIEMYSDGTNWYWVGFGVVAASIRTT